MSDKIELAKAATSLCVACLSLTWTPAAIGSAAVPLLGLIALGQRLWDKCPERAAAKAINEVLDGMRAAHIPARDIDAAVTALGSLPSAMTLNAKALSDAAKAPAGLNATLTATLMRHLPESLGYDTRSLIETALTSGFNACSKNPDFKKTLTKSLILETARDVGLVLAGLERVETKLDALPQQLLALLREQGIVSSAATGVSLDDLRALASKFGDTGGTTPGDMIQFLDHKAQEYHAYRAQIDTIDARTVGLGNLKAAAKDAAARLDFDEVETLLARIDEVETEIAAETKELRADNALLRGRVDQAFTLFSAAANSFAALDPLAPARRRLGYAARLLQHGRRYGGSGLALAARMNTDTLRHIDRAAAPELWAKSQNNLAAALFEQSTHIGGAQSAVLLAQAAEALTAALLVRTRTAYPEDWADTQNNLGVVLQAHGLRTDGAEGEALLKQAVAAFDAALEVHTRATHPVDWAITQNNLANALRNQGIRTDETMALALLAQAVQAYRTVLEVHTRADHPLAWAETQNNLAIALTDQGSRTPGTEGAALLAEAGQAYRAALEVFTRVEYPLAWAMILNNLAAVLANQGDRTRGEEGRTLLAQAAAAFGETLAVRTRADHPVQWAETQENLAILEQSRSRHDGCTDPHPHLLAAVGHVEAALQVFDPEHMAFSHHKATELRARLLTQLRALGDDV